MSEPTGRRPGPHDDEPVVLDAIDDAVPPEEGGARGLRAITADEFSAADAVGGVRGMVEAVAPGLLFVVVYIAAGQQLRPALIAASVAAVLAVVARLVQRTPVTQAFSGVLGVGIGVIWAWRTGDASDYFAYGLLVNVAYLVGTLVSVVAGWPLVGLVVGMFSARGPLGGGPWSAAVEWRHDPALRRRYALATWPWVGMFGLRLLVQLPLFLADEVVWLGTAKLAMGLPLTAVALWLSWMLVRGSAGAPAPSRPPRDP
ncbi:DUF3159 domain-containing protein [Cellulomonas sp. zg-ZUI22]|uniref:DUF3159 domain-containing protein n=1 Tax=Cellulomonas sp. zg-ZUI22 TaxID=2816955 RepID=UPI001A951FD3|nr:DUF3159 domain-containing protein [Cellulomonas sp. zg-ZUI22]MBO0900507.1 DUF3159 domain-containing protein [Cellulomonas sp. zg-ZUI22]